MCDKAVEKASVSVEYVPYEYKTKQMWERVFEDNPNLLDCVPDQYKAQEMCERVLLEEPVTLEYVLDCYVKLEGMSYEDFDNDDELVE